MSIDYTIFRFAYDSGKIIKEKYFGRSFGKGDRIYLYLNEQRTNLDKKEYIFESRLDNAGIKDLGRSLFLSKDDEKFACRVFLDIIKRKMSELTDRRLEYEQNYDKLNKYLESLDK